MTAGIWPVIRFLPYSSLHPLHNEILPSNYAISSLRQRFICIHLLNPYLTAVPPFPNSFTTAAFAAFAALGGLITLPEQRYRYFNQLN